MKRLTASLAAALLLSACATQPAAPSSRTPKVAASHSEAMQPPIPRVQFVPLYPFEMRRAGIQGEVQVSFIVDTEGRVSDAHVVQTTNAAFNNAALAAVLRWLFLPGMVGNKPVNTRLLVPIEFNLNEANSPAYARLGGVPVYPPDDIAEKKTGFASVAVDIDKYGHVTDARLLAASAPEFGLALMAAAQAPKYFPAQKDGKAVASHFVLSRAFAVVPTPKQGTVCPSGPDQDFALRVVEEPESLCAEKDLDAPLVLETNVVPVCPIALRGKAGRVTVAYYIDEEGRARLPRVVSATDPAFGYSVVQAVSNWVFTPPVRNGRPSAVAMLVTYAFNPDGRPIHLKL